MKIVSLYAGTEHSPLAQSTGTFPRYQCQLLSSIQSTSYGPFLQPALQKEQTRIVLSCLSTLFKSMKLSLGERDGVFQASKGETFLSTLTHSNVIAAEAGIHLHSL